LKRSSHEYEKHFRARKRGAPAPCSRRAFARQEHPDPQVRDGAAEPHRHIFFHPDCDASASCKQQAFALNRRLWHRTRSADLFAGKRRALAGFIAPPVKASRFTAGGESRPALKTCAAVSGSAAILRPSPCPFASQGRQRADTTL
jgi:hypothetical protein